jgi:hypothetical protein
MVAVDRGIHNLLKLWRQTVTQPAARAAVA